MSVGRTAPPIVVEKPRPKPPGPGPVNPGNIAGALTTKAGAALTTKKNEAMTGK